ncbi:hypothetical protein P6O24_15245, partial [Clostridium perfringens]|nr:hypothetical protein [Clostridium perfringens]
LVNKYNNLLSDLEAKKNAVLKEAKSKAQQIVADSNKLIEKTIRDIKEKKAEKDITKQLREDYQKSVTDLLDNEKESPTQLIEISKTNTGEEKS